MAKEDLDRIATEIRESTLSICKQNNKKFISKVIELLPGFISEFSDEELAFLPLLPLEAFLAIVDNPAPALRVARAVKL
ncbi:MAG: hypothetical protein AAF939_04600 [Planctomycetota bacterium]